MTCFLEDDPSYRGAIGHLLSATGSELLAGGPRTLAGTRCYNSAFLIGPTGEIAARYDEQYLPPFAEHFPFGSIGLLRRHFGGEAMPSPRASEVVASALSPTLADAYVGSRISSIGARAPGRPIGCGRRRT